MTVPRGAGPSRSRRPRRKGGCCGCFIVVALFVLGGFWLARKWAPRHLATGIAWGQGQLTQRFPQLAPWLPSAKPTPSPVQSTPSPIVSPGATPEPIELPVGTGEEATLGHTIRVRYNQKTAEFPELFMVGAGEVPRELDQVVRGMRVGGKRRLGDVEIELVDVL